MLKQWLLALVVIGVFAAGAGIYLTWEAEQPEVAARTSAATGVQVVQPQVQQVRDEVKAVASLRALQSVDLVAQVSGQLLELNFAAGSQVTAGTVLLQLDAREAKAEVAEFTAQLADAERQYQRAQQLSTSRSISPAQVDEFKTAVAVAQAKLDAAQVRLEQHQIRAPFTGVVGLSDLSPGAYITAGSRITSLDAVQQLELVFAVPELFLSQLFVGQAVSATSAALAEQVFVGQLIKIAPRVDELSRTLEVRALLDNAAGKLRPGQFMAAALTLNERSALVIPEQAVLLRGKNKYVFTAVTSPEGLVAQRVAVVTGARLPGWVEIKQGLTSADQVVVTGQERLSSAQRLSLLDAALALPQNRFQPTQAVGGN